MPYQSVAEFRNLTTLPAEFVDAIESSSPGWIAGQLEYWSAQIDARLAKRYATPFASPYPISLCGWLTRIVTVRCWLKRGLDSNDSSFAEITKDADGAWAEIKEAADAEAGLFELPLRANTTAGGVVRGGPRSYSEQSPWVGFDRQGAIGRSEDSNRGGSYG